MRRSHYKVIRSALAACALLACRSALAAPCCGGGSALPALITGDDKAQVSVSVSQASVVGDAPARGIAVFRTDSDSERMQTLQLDGAYRISDRFQAGAAIPIARRLREVTSTSAAASGLGDVSVSLGYEALPEWSYSVWRPRGFLFLQATAPTSPSTNDSQAPFQIDARGRGFFQLGLGFAALKSFGTFDFIASLEGHRSFARTFNSASQGELTLIPGWGGRALLGAGYSPWSGSVRLGLSVASVYEGAIVSRGEVDSRSEPQHVFNTSAQLSYLLSDEWSATASYTDQTLLGPARNVSLSRSAALSAQKRWSL